MRAPGCLAVIVVAAGLSISAQAGGESIVDRFLTREEPAVVRYVATRRLEASNERFNLSPWMDVRVELSPDTGFTCSSGADAAETSRLQLKPRRKEGLLIDGHAIITSADGVLFQVEGRLAKNPSKWTRRVGCRAAPYARIAGFR